MNIQTLQGQFSKKEAIDIITQLIQVEIEFHENKMEDSKNKEHIKTSKLKIKQLKKKLHEVTKYIKQYKDGVELDSITTISRKGAITVEPIHFIEGTFQPQDAKEILMTLVNDKINFHTKRNFSAMERFNVEDELSQKRLPELVKIRETVSNIMKEAAEKNKIVKVHSMIHITLEDDL